MWAQIGQITNTAWKNTCGTLAVQLQHGSQAKQNYHSIMDGVELDRCASGHEMSSQQSVVASSSATQPGSPWESRSLPTTSQLHLFCTTWSLLRTILDPASWWLSQSCDSYAAAFCCRDVGPNGPNNKHSLEEHLWHVGSTTSAVASLRVERLGWLPIQAKLPLHDGWRRAWQMCQWPWNAKSTIRKAKLPRHIPGSPWENWSLLTTSQLHLFCTTWSLLRTILHPASWWLCQSCDSYAAAFCCRDVGPNGPNNKHSSEEHLWHVGSTTSAVASLRVARLGWLPSQDQLKPDLPQHKPGSPWENWSLPTTSQLHLFCTTWSLLRTILDPASWWLSQSCDSYAAAFCCRDVGPNGPNNKHSLEEHLWHVGSTTSAVASLRVERLGWLPSQDQSKPDLQKHKPKPVATYNFAASPFLQYMISTQDHFGPC